MSDSNELLCRDETNKQTKSLIGAEFFQKNGLFINFLNLPIPTLGHGVAGATQLPSDEGDPEQVTSLSQSNTTTHSYSLLRNNLEAPFNL